MPVFALYSTICLGNGFKNGKKKTPTNEFCRKSGCFVGFEILRVAQDDTWMKCWGWLKALIEILRNAQNDT